MSDEENIYNDAAKFEATHKLKKLWVLKQNVGQTTETAIYLDVDTGYHWVRWIEARSDMPYYERLDGDLETYIKATTDPTFTWITPEEGEIKRSQELELKQKSDERFIELEKKFIEAYPDELTQHRVLTEILLKHHYQVSPVRNDLARRRGIEFWAGVKPYFFFD